MKILQKMRYFLNKYLHTHKKEKKASYSRNNERGLVIEKERNKGETKKKEFFKNPQKRAKMLLKYLDSRKGRQFVFFKNCN